ncbi:MAG: DoxX family protein [Gemmatimonadetes bacterium]|nr:DoxX family protein [Gemmatimonadota bacterium]
MSLQTSLQRHPRRTNISLWTAQAILAALFIFAGSMKFIMPLAEMQKGVALPGPLLYFIGACEVLGGLGLLLPGLTKIATFLTPLAAAGLAIIMVGAVVITLMSMPANMAILPFVTGIIACVVCWARSRVLPLGSRALPTPALP